MKNVLIGIPVKNCAKWLETVVDQIINIDYPKQYISIIFLENDSVDNSLDVIRHCCNNKLSRYPYKFIHYEKRDVGFHLPHESRHDFRHMEGRMNSLKIIRNYIVDTYLKDNDYLWWVDADYKIIPMDLLKIAITHKKDIMMPRVEVNGINYDGMTCGFVNNQPYNIKEISTLVGEEIYPMEITECAAIISNKVFESGIRYDSCIVKLNDGSETFLQEGPYFSYHAKQKGFKLYGMLKHIIEHQEIDGTTPFDF